MTYSLPKTAVLGFLFTAAVYLLSLSFINYPLTTFVKPIPILCLIIGVLQTDLLRWAKILIIAALGFSMLGDIILTLPIQLVLVLGIGCFLLAHCCYIALFLKSFKYRISHIFYYIPIVLFIGFFGVVLIPHLGSLLIPVIIYICILMLMVFSAFQVNHQGLIIGGGALLFLISDLSLAFNVFMYPGMNVLPIVVMSTYYAAQLLLTWGLVILYKG